MDVWLCRGVLSGPLPCRPSSFSPLSRLLHLILTRSSLVFSRNEPTSRHSLALPAIAKHPRSAASGRASVRRTVFSLHASSPADCLSPITANRSSFVLHKFTHSQMVQHQRPKLALLTVISGSAPCSYGKFGPIYLNFRIPVRVSGPPHGPRERPIRFRFVFFSAKPIPPNRLPPSASCFLPSPSADAPTQIL